MSASQAKAPYRSVAQDTPSSGQRNQQQRCVFYVRLHGQHLHRHHARKSASWSFRLHDVDGPPYEKQTVCHTFKCVPCSCTSGICRKRQFLLGALQQSPKRPYRRQSESMAISMPESAKKQMPGKKYMVDTTLVTAMTIGACCWSFVLKYH